MTHMAESLKSIGAITLFVDDPQRSKAFYTRVFEAEVLFEDANSAALRFDNLILQFPQAGRGGRRAARSRPPAASGASFQLTVWVDDADAVCTELADRGVEIVTGPLDRPWGVRTATFLDPDGYLWEVAASIPSA